MNQPHAITAVVVPYMGVAPIYTPTEVGLCDFFIATIGAWEEPPIHPLYF